MQNVINLAYFNDSLQNTSGISGRKRSTKRYDHVTESLIYLIYLFFKKLWLWAGSLFLFLEMSTIGPIRACQSHLRSIRKPSLILHTIAHRKVKSRQKYTYSDPEDLLLPHISETIVSHLHFKTKVQAISMEIEAAQNTAIPSPWPVKSRLFRRFRRNTKMQNVWINRNQQMIRNANKQGLTIWFSVRWDVTW